MQGEDSVPWDAASGSYITARSGDSLLTVHFNVGSGSTPALQLQAKYKNNGIAYRSARDRFGFEEPWTEFYTTKNKPSAADVGAFTQTTYMPKIPDQSYIGAFSCGHEGGWVKGISVGSNGGDVGQIWIDSSAMLHTRFLNTNGNHRQQSYAVRGESYTKQEADNRFLGSVPVGVPLPWPQDKPPTGYLICNGERFDKARYPKLALAYPSGILPDLRGEFIRGLDVGRNVDSGRKVLSSQLDCIQDHAHLAGVESTFGFSVPQNGSHRNVPGGFKSNGGNTSTGPTNSNWNNIKIGTETRPRNIAFLYIVKAA
nr:phage tail protein [Xenorhabdus sp. 12]